MTTTYADLLNKTQQLTYAGLDFFEEGVQELYKDNRTSFIFTEEPSRAQIEYAEGFGLRVQVLGFSFKEQEDGMYDESPSSWVLTNA